MEGDREKLDMNLDDLNDFEPRATQKAQGKLKHEVDRVSHFPSRESSEDAQLNMKGRKAVLNRFKATCKKDRRSYVDMLEILMDCFEEGQG